MHDFQSISRAFQAESKGEAHDWVIVRVDHHLVLKVSDMLNWITYSKVIVKSRSQKFCQELTLLDLLGERTIVNSDS